MTSKLIRAAFCALILLSIPNCSSGPIRDSKDLPEKTEYFDTKERFKLPVVWFWRKSPTKVDRGAFSSNLIDDEMLQNVKGETGLVIGKIPIIGDEDAFVVIQYRGEFWFARLKDVIFFQSIEKYVLKSEQERNVDGFINSQGQSRASSIISEMECANNWGIEESNLLWQKKLRTANSFQFQLGQAIYFGNAPLMDQVIQIWPVDSIRPMAVFLCGLPAGKKMLETQSGLMRNFPVVSVRYVIFYWGSMILAFPAS